MQFRMSHQHYFSHSFIQFYRVPMSMQFAHIAKYSFALSQTNTRRQHHYCHCSFSQLLSLHVSSAKVIKTRIAYFRLGRWCWCLRRHQLIINSHEYHNLQRAAKRACTHTHAIISCLVYTTPDRMGSNWTVEFIASTKLNIISDFDATLCRENQWKYKIFMVFFCCFCCVFHGFSSAIIAYAVYVCFNQC